MATTHYRDIGVLGAQNAPQVLVDTNYYTQVYKATHDGTQRLPYMYRSFISFTFGGKFIEDFNLIAYTPGDRMEREAYASFNDLTSSYDVIQGQFYWGTYYSTNSLNLSLATDGMTQQDLDDFKYWFRAGSIRELIMAERPNRAIMARVATPPQLNLLPFEHPVTISLNSGEQEYYTSTTLYKGEIQLELVMDEPFWYAKQNLLGVQDVLEGYYNEQWQDIKTGRLVDIRESADALKIIYEDHIPLGSTVKVSVFLGGDTYASVAYEIWSQIVQASNENEYAAAHTEGASKQTQYAYFTDKDLLGGGTSGSTPIQEETPSEETEGEEAEGENVENKKTEPVSEALEYYKGGRIAEQQDGAWIGAVIGGAQTSGTSEQANGVSLPPTTEANLYYAGNAPAPVKLRFTLKPSFANNYYIIVPGSKYNENYPYSTITLEATMKHEFKFTLPTFWLSYNQVLKIFDNSSIIREGNAWLTVRETIRDTIRHPIIRKWANLLLDKYDAGGKNGIIGGNLESVKGDLKYGMMMLFQNNQGEGLPATFTFDGKTGEAIGEFQYRDFPNDLTFIQSYNNAGVDIATLRQQLLEASAENENYATSVENVGDMVKSSYLILDERNVLDGNLCLQAWEESHPDYAYKITHDLPVGISEGLQDLHFEFKNMYL